MKAWTNSDVTTLHQMKDAGSTNLDIANRLKRTEVSVGAKYNKLNRDARKKPKTYRIPKTVVTPQSYRPMMALVGSPSEVTQTIRELFS